MNLASFYAGAFILFTEVLIVVVPLYNFCFSSHVGITGFTCLTYFVVFLPDNEFTQLCRLLCFFLYIYCTVFVKFCFPFSVLVSTTIQLLSLTF